MELGELICAAFSISRPYGAVVKDKAHTLSVTFFGTGFLATFSLPCKMGHQ